MLPAMKLGPVGVGAAQVAKLVTYWGRERALSQLGPPE
jgi:hypothetical protein